MSFLSRLSIAAANFDFEVKKFFRSMFEVATIAAAGSDQTDATALTAGMNLVTAANGTKGVILPVAEVEMRVEVINTVANQILKVYPNTGAQINALTATTGAFSQQAGSRVVYVCDAALHWYCPGANLTGVATTATQAELDAAAGVTLGTSAPSKNLTTDSAESLVWATTDATASETCTLTITDTRTGAGATGWAAKFDLESDVALGSYANGVYGIINFGASGKCTGLAAGVVGEITLSAGTTDGTYAALEAEFNVPTGASLGTNSSLMYLSVNGDDASTFDTSGYFLTLAGVTVGDTKMFDGTLTIAADELTHGLKVKIAGADYYIPLVTYANAQD